MTLLTHYVREGMKDQFGVWEELDKRMSIVHRNESPPSKDGTTEGTTRSTKEVLVEIGQFKLSPIKLGDLSLSLDEAQRRHFVLGYMQSPRCVSHSKGGRAQYSFASMYLNTNTK